MQSMISRELLRWKLEMQIMLQPLRQLQINDQTFRVMSALSLQLVVKAIGQQYQVKSYLRDNECLQAN